VSYLRAIDLVLEHPAYSGSGEEYPEEDKEVDEVRYEGAEVGQQRHLLQVGLR
jgi:hypothetical protein